MRNLLETALRFNFIFKVAHVKGRDAPSDKYLTVPSEGFTIWNLVTLRVGIPVLCFYPGVMLGYIHNNQGMESHGNAST